MDITSNKRKSHSKKERSGMNVDLLRETISSSEAEEETVNIENINLNEISDNNWSDSEDETFWGFIILFEFSLYYLSTLKTLTLKMNVQDFICDFIIVFIVYSWWFFSS